MFDELPCTVPSVILRIQPSDMQEVERCLLAAGVARKQEKLDLSPRSTDRCPHRTDQQYHLRELSQQVSFTLSFLSLIRLYFRIKDFFPIQKQIFGKITKIIPPEVKTSDVPFCTQSKRPMSLYRVIKSDVIAFLTLTLPFD